MLYWWIEYERGCENAGKRNVVLERKREQQTCVQYIPDTAQLNFSEAGYDCVCTVLTFPKPKVEQYLELVCMVWYSGPCADLSHGFDHTLIFRSSKETWIQAFDTKSRLTSS